MIRKEPQTFEVAGYSDVEFGMAEAQRVIAQIFKDIERDCPAHAVWGDFTGDQLKVHYMTYVMHLPSRTKQVEEEAEEVFKQTVSHVKKEFKARTGKVLKLKEQRDLAGHAAEKVSLNQRFYYKAWCFYQISF